MDLALFAAVLGRWRRAHSPPACTHSKWGFGCYSGMGKLHGLWGEGSELTNWVWCLPGAPAMGFDSFLLIYMIYHNLSFSEASDFLRGTWPCHVVLGLQANFCSIIFYICAVSWGLNPSPWCWLSQTVLLEASWLKSISERCSIQVREWE